MTATLFAATKQQDLFRDPNFYIGMGVLVGALLLLAVVIHFVSRWQKRTAEPDAGRSSTLELTDYREMYENGEITQGEYDRIRGKLAAKMKREVGLADAGRANGEAVAGPPADSPPPPPPAG
jgi:hypothetical protein